MMVAKVSSVPLRTMMPRSSSHHSPRLLRLLLPPHQLPHLRLPHPPPPPPLLLQPLRHPRPHQIPRHRPRRLPLLPNLRALLPRSNLAPAVLSVSLPAITVAFDPASCRRRGEELARRDRSADE